MASEYIDQFPKEKVALVMRFVVNTPKLHGTTGANASTVYRFVAFIAGSFAAVLAAATLVDPDIFLHFEITPHRTVLFYLGVFGTILAAARGMVPDSHRVFDPEILMREVISQTHYMPTEWKGELHSQKVRISTPDDECRLMWRFIGANRVRQALRNESQHLCARGTFSGPHPIRPVVFPPAKRTGNHQLLPRVYGTR